MNSRPFAILVLVIFISTMAPVFGGNKTSSVSSDSQPANQTHDFSSTVSSSLIMSTQIPRDFSKTTLAPDTTKATTLPATVINASATTGTTAEAKATAVMNPTAITVPSITSIGMTSAAPTNGIASTKPTNIVNDQSVRDVSSEKCSTSFNAADKSKWIPEKAILAVSDGQNIITAEQFCKEQDSVNRLEGLCEVKLSPDDEKFIPIVAAVASMFASICSDPKFLFNVTIGDSTPCVESITTIAKNCSRSQTAKTQIFPTELLFDEMMKENCTSVLKTKQCIIKSIENNEKCGSAQRSAITQTIKMLNLPCNPPADQTTTAVPFITTAVPTTKVGPPNSASSLHINVFTVLPFFLGFKFY